MTAQTETNYKSTLAEIEAGDFVVVHNSGYGGGYTLKSVDRATKTQITVGNTIATAMKSVAALGGTKITFTPRSKNITKTALCLKLPRLTWQNVPRKQSAPN
jgi:hypothetical protein